MSALLKKTCRTQSFFLYGILLLASACHHETKIYQSICNADITFRKVQFSNLLDSINYYHDKYVEVTGIYLEGKQQSGLYCDSLFVDHTNQRGLWVDFSQDCPLYLQGTQAGLFESNKGEYTSIHNVKLTLKGKINARNKGYLNEYRGALERVSYLKLKR